MSRTPVLTKILRKIVITKTATTRRRGAARSNPKLHLRKSSWRVGLLSPSYLRMKRLMKWLLASYSTLQTNKFNLKRAKIREFKMVKRVKILIIRMVKNKNKKRRDRERRKHKHKRVIIVVKMQQEKKW